MNALELFNQELKKKKKTTNRKSRRLNFWAPKHQLCVWWCFFCVLSFSLSLLISSFPIISRAFESISSSFCLEKPPTKIEYRHTFGMCVPYGSLHFNGMQMNHVRFLAMLAWHFSLNDIAIFFLFSYRFYLFVLFFFFGLVYNHLCM